MLSSLSRRRVVVLLILTSLLLITLDRRGNNASSTSRGRRSRLIMRPFDIAADAVSKPIANAWHGITNYDDLQRENEALRDQVEHQKGAEIEAQTAIIKFHELLKLNRLDVGAQLQERDRPGRSVRRRATSRTPSRSPSAAATASPSACRSPTARA